MIFYFSATGNTKWIAESAAAVLHDTAVDLRTADPAAYSFSRTDRLGICFPVYACQAPLNVQAFAHKLRPEGAYTFAICDYSNFTGHALEQFSREVLPLDSGWGLLMPDNTSVLGYTYDDEASTREKLRTAPARLQAILEHIKKREKGILDAYEGPDPDAFDTLAEKFYAGALTSPFTVSTEKCISCGLCQRNCPVQAIVMENGHPVWQKDHCYLCSACINNCPAEAIEYGDKSQGVYRYTWTKYNS